jgi:hypothetical protein
LVSARTQGETCFAEMTFRPVTASELPTILAAPYAKESRMHLRRYALCLALAGCPLLAAAMSPADPGYARDPQQPVDEAYSKKIAEYTTDPSFNSPLTDYLPASSTVPTPAKVLGDVAGAPNMLPYSKDVYRYFDARSGEPAREGLPHRQDRGRTRHDGGRDRRGITALDLGPTTPVWRSSPTRARSAPTRKPSHCSQPRRLSSTSPARSIRRKPARQPH